MLGFNHTFHTFSCQRHLVIDNGIIILTHQGNFFFCFLNPLSNHFCTVCATTNQTVFQLFQVWRSQKDKHSIGHFFLDLECSLDFDFQENIYPLIQGLIDISERSPVIIADILCIFEHLPLTDQLLKLFTSAKEIINTINFSRTLRTSRHRYRILKLIVRTLKNFPSYCSFSNA